jgi:hypothetical protein
MAGGFCRGRAAPAVESKIFFIFSRSDRPEISIRQKLNKEQMEIPGRSCRKESSWYMMNVSERQKMETINTPYDDTFRTLLQDCPELVVPLINELFGTNYTGREVVVSNENEIFLRNPEGKKEKRVTDSNLTLISLKGISKRYHLECQSTADGTMEIRMWEYDAQIALMNKEYRDGVLYVNFPDSAVIYLRSNSNTPDELKICICVGEKEIFYEIPILKVKNYTLNEIFKKQLWLLIPFYIFRYEKEFRKINGDEERLHSLRMEYENVAARLDQECQSGRMKPITGGALCELANNVVEKLASKYDNVEKEVTEVMGGKVLNYRSKEIFREAMEKGLEEGRLEGSNQKTIELVTKKYQKGDSASKIAEDLLMSVEEVEEILGEMTVSQ